MLVTRIFHEFQEVSSSFDFSDTQGLTVCDYGSSQGKNSSMLFASVLPGFRKAKGDSVPILLYHNDVPHNDWGTLFDTSNSEVYKDKNIFVSGIGHSFSSQILPPRTVHISWSAIAVHWLYHKLPSSSTHIIGMLDTDEIRHQWEKIAAMEWDEYVGHRATELKPGGKIVIVGMTTDPTPKDISYAYVVNGMNLTYKNMVEDGSITQEEYNNTNINAYHRSREEFLEPFPKHSFEVDSTEVIRLNDPHTEEYRQTKDKETYCSRLVGFFQSWSEASIISGLSEKRTKEEKHQISDKFYARFKSWMLDHCEDPEFLATCFGIYIVIRATYNPRSQA